MSNATVWVCGAWIRLYYILCPKIYNTLGGLFWAPASSRRAARGARICENGLLVSYDQLLLKLDQNKKLFMEENHFF